MLIGCAGCLGNDDTAGAMTLRTMRSGGGPLIGPDELMRACDRATPVQGKAAIEWETGRGGRGRIPQTVTWRLKQVDLDSFEWKPGTFSLCRGGLAGALAPACMYL